MKFKTQIGGKNVFRYTSEETHLSSSSSSSTTSSLNMRYAMCLLPQVLNARMQMSPHHPYYMALHKNTAFFIFGGKNNKIRLVSNKISLKNSIRLRDEMCRCEMCCFGRFEQVFAAFLYRFCRFCIDTFKDTHGIRSKYVRKHKTHRTYT